MSIHLFLFLCLTPQSHTPQRLGTLEEVLQPQLIKVHGQELFAVEDHEIFIYSLPDLKLKQKISRAGEGPGEFTLDPSRSLNISVHANSILAQSRTKYIFFDRKGVMQREGRKRTAILQLYPLGDQFVVLRITNGEGGRQYFSLNIYNSEMKNVKELHRQKFFTFLSEIHPMPDPLNFCVVNNQIYVEKSVEGFQIDVYNDRGDLVDSIQRDAPKIEVTDQAKEAALQELLNIPSMQRVRQEQGQSGVTAILNESKQVYPDYVPPIDNIIGDRDRIYVKTFQQTAKGVNWLVLDAKGRRLKETILPVAARPPFLIRLQGDKNLYTVHDGTYYYLKNTPDGEDEIWEVFCMAL